LNDAWARSISRACFARLLTRDAAPELGDGREVRSLAFQQAPRVSVDDLVIEAARPHETDPSVELAIGIRRSPNLVRSDEDSQKLITEYLRALASAGDDGREHRLALAVAGHQPHAEQLAELAALARNQTDAASFFSLVNAGVRSARRAGSRVHRRTLGAGHRRMCSGEQAYRDGPSTTTTRTSRPASSRHSMPS
jgi:hypothetical protein